MRNRAPREAGVSPLQPSAGHLHEGDHTLRQVIGEVLARRRIIAAGTPAFVPGVQTSLSLSVCMCGNRLGKIDTLLQSLNSDALAFRHSSGSRRAEAVNHSALLSQSTMSFD